MLRKSMFIVPFMLCGTLADAGEQTIREATRGELLYAAHCEGCHNVQVHWRDKTVVADWTSLKLEVRRWQAVAGAGWSDEDIAAVASYLNELHYHYLTPE